MAWRLSLEAGYPNLLSAEDVERRERIVLKLLRLIPKEYQSGVRDGEVTIPIEFREAKSFTIQTQQIVNELMPVWRQTKTQALEKYGPELLATLENLESAIERKTAQSEVDSIVDKGANLLQRLPFPSALTRLAPLAERVPIYDLGRGPLPAMIAQLDALAYSPSA